MEFETIVDTFYGKAKFLFDIDGRPAGGGRVDGLSDRRALELIDSLYDCDGVTIARNASGELFAYESIYRDGSFIPAVWQRIAGYVGQADDDGADFRPVSGGSID